MPDPLKVVLLQIDSFDKISKAYAPLIYEVPSPEPQRSQSAELYQTNTQPVKPLTSSGSYISSPAVRLPPPVVEESPWEEYQDEEGNPYFYNKSTGETCWEKP